MTHPTNWGKGDMMQIAEADVVIAQGDEGSYEFLKDRRTQFNREETKLRIIFIDDTGHRHDFLAVRSGRVTG